MSHDLFADRLFADRLFADRLFADRLYAGWAVIRNRQAERVAVILNQLPKP